MKILSLDYGVGRYAALFNHSRHEVDRVRFINEDTDPIQDYDLIMFTGGSDVSPELYGEAPLASGFGYNEARDKYEKDIFELAVEHQVPMVGICRGAQFLCVMNGGKLVQDCDCHTNYHMMQTDEGQMINVTSTHHQMMIPDGDFDLLSWANEISSYKMGAEGHLHTFKKEPETVWWPDTTSLAFQYHPEMMIDKSLGYKYFFSMIDKYIGEDE